MPRTAEPRRSHDGRGEDRTAIVGLEAAKSTLRRYGMLDERVTFVEGYFNETLGDMPAEALALIHIDADATVHDALVGAYDRLSPGGHVVIDDWHLPGVRAAVHDCAPRGTRRAPRRRCCRCPSTT